MSLDDDHRIGLTEYFVGHAQLAAARGTCDRAKVGAVLVRDKRVIAEGYNGAPPKQKHCSEVGCDDAGRGGGCGRTTHAEANVIAFAAKHGIRTDGATMYTTMSPCVDCAKLIVAAGIVHVHYNIRYRDPAGENLLVDCGVGVTGREIA